MDTDNSADDSLKANTILALLTHSRAAQHNRIKRLLPKFSSPLKSNFEDRNLWLRYGLSLGLSGDSPQSALQAFIECLRIDQYDPSPAMLAARLMLEELDQPEAGLKFAIDAIERCQRLAPNLSHTTLLDQDQDEEEGQQTTPTANNVDQDVAALSNGNHTTNSIPNGHDDVDNMNHNHITNNSIATTINTNTLTHHNQHKNLTQANEHIQNDIVIRSRKISSTASPNTINAHYLEAKCCYKNIAPLLSKSYLLAGIMHAQIYEREPESIKVFKISNLKASFSYLDLANKIYPNDYLVHFHKALHKALQGYYLESIENVREAIRLNPEHVPSMQLFILSLSALRRYDEAFVLCESALHEFENDLLLLYIKCNLEQCLVETKGYKSALNTAQHILKCIRLNNASANNNSATTNGPSSPMPSPKQVSGEIRLAEEQKAADMKQTSNLFVEDGNNNSYRIRSHNPITEELSVWLLVAEIFIKIGSIHDAELCVDEGATRARQALSPQIMFTRGLIAKAKNNLTEAKSFFQSCLALCPRHSKALQQIAHVHYLLGNHPTAEKFLKDSLDLNNSDHKTWHYLSLVNIETNQREKASECAKKATQLQESSPVIPIAAISRLTLE